MFVLALAGSTTAVSIARAQQPPAGPPDPRRTPVVEAYERVRDSVVNISATEKLEVRRWGMNMFGDVFPVPQEFSNRSVGSGFVIHPDGYIATNAHVVSAGADLKAIFANGRSFDARIIGRDTPSDLAVIKIEPDQPLPPIALGRSDDLMIGEPTIAIGNPVGLQNTLTTGVVSALHRELRVGDRVVYHNVIQTDASINPGNSGGPLLNILGELIGINTAIRADAQNIGFAVPVDQLRAMLPDILDSEKLNDVQVGMKVGGPDPPQVIEVRAGSPADKAGIKPGDIVEAIDGTPVRRGVDLYVAMLDRGPNDVVHVRLQRDGARREVELALTAAPKPDGDRLAMEKLGLSVTNLKDKVAQRLGGRGPRGGPGVIVVGVDPRSPAAQSDMRPGDVLVSMGPYWLTDVNQVGTLLSNIGPGDPVDIGFRREYRGRLYDGEARLYAR